MASDDLVWNIIGTDFCSFKIKTTKDQVFCKNENNVSGFCSRQACPLANSRYATVRSDPATGNIYLYIKEVERAHLPSKWFEKIKLSNNYVKALEQLDSHLQYFPKFLVHKNKQRLTRLTQVRLRINRLEKESERLGERLVPRLAPKVRRREEGRERKALAAAKLERSIERVLVDRLRSGAYGDRPLNVEPNVWAKVLKGLEKQGQATRDNDLDEGIEEENEFEEENELENEAAADVEYVSDIDESEDDMEDFDDWLGGQSPDGGDDDSGESDEESEESGESEDDDDETEKLKKTLASLKRKRPSAPPAKPKKKPAKNPKGARVEIQYEREQEQREQLVA